MNDELKKMLKALERLNNYTNQSIAGLNEFVIEYGRLKDLKELDREVHEKLAILKDQSLIDINNTIEQICYLDINVALYAWHIEQVKSITEKFIGLYRDKVFWKDVEL